MKLLNLGAVLVAAVLSYCAVIQSPPSRGLIVRATALEVMRSESHAGLDRRKTFWLT